jgi:peptidoglycan hydrolase CwlO-like protein
MPLNYTIVKDKIKSFLLTNNKDNIAKKIFIIGGMFGSGKSACVREVCADIKDMSMADALFFLNPLDARILADIPACFFPLITNSELIDTEIVIEESAFNRQKLFDVIDFVNSRDQAISDRAFDFLALKSKWEQFIYLKQNPDASPLFEKLSVCVEKKSHMIYFNDTAGIITESFIVDLMNTFYPSGKEGFTSTLNRPLKIVFVLDEYDSLSGSIDNWLSGTFFKYCYDMPLSDYKYYTISQAKEGSKASDFFDFRFIISGREPLKNYEGNISLKDFDSIIDESVLKPLERAEVKEYIEKKGISQKEIPQNIFDITQGVPLLLDFYLDYSLNESNCDTSALYKFAFNQIFKFRHESEKQWIISASYLDIITPQGLRCFPGIKPLAEDLHTLILLTSDIIEHLDNKGITISPFIKKIIVESLYNESPDMAAELASIAPVCNSIADLMSGLSAREFEAARNLAYFDRFELNYNIEKAYQNDAALVNNLLIKKSGRFTSDKFTFRLNDNEKSKFLEYNKLVDQDRFEEKQLMTNALWRDYESELSGKIKDGEREIPELNKKLADIEKFILSVKQRHNEIQPKFMEIENSLIETRKALSLFSPQTYFSYAGINFLVAIVALVLAFFLPAIFDKGTNHTAIGTSKDILLVIMGIFAIIGFAHIGRYISKLSKKEERSALESVLKNGEDERNSLLEEMRLIKEKNDSAQRQIFEINERLKRIKVELSELKDKIKPASV